MKGGEIELLRGRNRSWRFHDAGRFRNGLKLRGLERVGDQQGGTIGNGDGQAFREAVKTGIFCLGLCAEVCGCFFWKRNGNLIAVFRGKGGFNLVKDSIFQRDFDGSVLVNAGGVYLEKGFVSFFSEAECGVFRGVAHAAYAFVGHEILDEGFFLLGFQPGEIRLVVCEDAGHQLDVGAVFIGEVFVPGAAEITVAPGPLFLSGGNMVICYMKETSFSVFVIVSDEIVVGMSDHAFGAVHFVDFAQMNRAGAVGVLFQEIIHWCVGGGTMVLGPVKFDAAGDPGACKADQGWFDNMIIIDKIVVVRFVQGPLDAAAQFGKDHEFQVFVFQVDGVVGDVFFRVGNFFGYGQGIDFSGTALVGSFFDEEGIFFGWVDFIGGDKGVLFSDFYG